MVAGYIGLFIFLCFFVYIASQFYFDNEIESKGKETIAKIINSREISSNSGGSINARFLISFINEKNESETLQFDETIAQFYASRVQSGDEIKIKYLRKKNKTRVSFVFH